jgi:hypothetical protein
VVRGNPDINKCVADITAPERAGVPDHDGAMIASMLSEDNRCVESQRIALQPTRVADVKQMRSTLQLQSLLTRLRSS